MLTGKNKHYLSINCAAHMNAIPFDGANFSHDVFHVPQIEEDTDALNVIHI